MSFRRPRIKTKTHTPLSTPKASSSHQLDDVDSRPKQRRPYGASDLKILPERLLFEPHASFTQVTVPRDSNYQQIPISDDPFLALSQDDNFMESGLNNSLHITSEPVRSAKKKHLWMKWEQVVWSLVSPYLQLLRVSDSLRLSDYPKQTSSCSCNSPQRNLDVSCMYFDSKSYRKL